MKKGTAYDFWKSYIGLYTKNGASVKMENPAVDFTRRAKAGKRKLSTFTGESRRWMPAVC